MIWQIKIVKPFSENQIEEKSYEINLNKNKSIYKVIKEFEDEILNKAGFGKVVMEFGDVELGEIINLHNSEGIRDISQIRRMAKDIKLGKHIFNKSGIPNIKLIKSNKGELVLFDGHHSILAYMLNDKKRLDEIPYLIIEKKGGFDDEKIKEFFIEHKNKLKNKDWRKFVINWQADEENQLVERKEKCMDDVFNNIKNLFYSKN